jgi:RNA polymerase sigma-70 factor (ECF subfamily)
MTGLARSRCGDCDLDAVLQACAAGDETALREIYEREGPRLLGVAVRIVGHRDLAEDVVQDAFIQIWERSRSFDPNRGSARGWIYSVVRNRARKLRRARGRQVMLEDHVLLGIFGGMDRGDMSSRSLAEECGLQHRLARLDPEKRASLLLAYVDGCTHREVAERLGVPIGTAKAWIRRGLTALRAEFGTSQETKQPNSG